MKSVVDVYPTGPTGMKTDRLMFKSPKGLGEESKLLNDLTEDLESFHEMDVNGQIKFLMLSPCRSTSLRIPFHAPTPPKGQEKPTLEGSRRYTSS